MISSQDTAVIDMLTGVPWKDIAVRHKNDWDAVVRVAIDEYVLPRHGAEGVEALKRAVADVFDALSGMHLVKGGAKALSKASGNGKSVPIKRPRSGDK